MSSVEAEEPETPQPQQQGAFEVAGERLETLLNAVRSNHDNLMDEVEDYSPEQRVTLMANCGMLITVIAFIACWLGSQDPLGGMTLTLSTLEAAGLGLAFALPLLACSAAGHSVVGKELFPVLEELHTEQRKLVAPMITGMSLGHLSVLFGFVVLPCLLFLLPMYQACWNAFEGLVNTSVLDPKPLFTSGPAAAAAAAASVPHLPGVLHILVPSVLSAYTAGFVVASCLTVREWELEAVSDALKSAERYFRLSMAEGRGAAAPLPPPASGAAPVPAAEAPAAAAAGGGADAGSRSVAQAFKLVAATWLLQRYQVARLGFVLSALNIAYLYVTWQLTWDLATPLTAAVLLCAAECYFSVKEQAKLDARAKEKLQRVQWRAGVLPRRAAGKDRGGGKGGKGGSA